MLLKGEVKEIRFCYYTIDVQVLYFFQSALLCFAETDKLVCSQHMGLHSSRCQNAAALMQRSWVGIPLKP